MRVAYALSLLIAAGFAWLLVRHVLERRRERALRERLRLEPSLPRRKAREDSERSEMRACEDPTTVARTIRRKEPAARRVPREAADGTRALPRV